MTVTYSTHAEYVTMRLRNHALPTSTEAALQDGIEAALVLHGLQYAREARLSSGRIDFLLEDGIGLEAKTRQPRRQILRQLQRYADDTTINALILVSGTFMGLPETLNGKPLYLVSCGRAAL